jgi:membrane-anchored protein YejM (alkaline phosphatase superfamily)
MRIKNILLFTFINLILWCLISLKYYFVSGFYGDAWGVVFTAAALPGHLFLYGLLMFALLLLTRLARPSAAKISCVTFGALFTLLFLTDAFIYSQYRFHISLAMLELFFGPAGREIFVFPPAAYLTASVFLSLLVLLQWFILFTASRLNIGKKATAFIVTFCLGALILYNGLYAWGRFNAIPSITYQISYFLWPVPISLNKKLRALGLQPKEKSLSVKDEGLLNYPLSPMRCDGGDAPNILFILVDAQRADLFNPDVMPNTFNFFKDNKNATVFTQHLSGGNATQAGVFSLFYSLPATYWNAAASGHIPPVFMRMMTALGYEMAIFSSAKLNSPEFHKNIFTEIQNLRIGSDGENKPQRDIDMQEDFLAFLKTHDKTKPFFGFMFYDSLHGYAYPEDYPEKFTPSRPVNYLTLTASTNPEPYLNRLKNSAHFVDSNLKEVFETIKRLGYDDNTIIVFTSDHGQEMNDTGGNFWGHNGNFTKYQIKVPLAVYWPKKEGGTVTYRTSHYDVVPTFMQDVFKCGNSIEDYSVGYNLFDNTPRPYVVSVSYTDKAVTAGDRVSVINSYGALASYDEEYNKTQTIDGALMADALKSLSKYYK